MPKRSEYDSRRLEAVLRAQDWIISRQQALACGLPSRTLDRWLTRRGPWQRLLPGVYAAATGKVTQVQREVAALAYAGPGSVITGSAALRWHGLCPPGPEIVDVLVPASVRLQSVGFVRILRTTRIPAQAHHRGPVRFAGAARAAADAARACAQFSDARAIVCEAVQRDACTVADLSTELDAGPIRHSANLRAALVELSDGIRSVAEGDLRRLIIRGQLPRPMFNARLYTLAGEFIAMIDAWWDDAGVGTEVDSVAYHTSAAAQERDRTRHDRLTAHGVLLLHFSPRQIRTEGPRILSVIRDTVDKGRRRPRLPIVAIPADQDWDTFTATRSQPVTLPRSRRPHTRSDR